MSSVRDVGSEERASEDVRKEDGGRGFRDIGAVVTSGAGVVGVGAGGILASTEAQ